MKRRVYVLLLLVVLSAGCLGAVTDDGEPTSTLERPNTTTTEAPTETSTQTEQAGLIKAQPVNRTPENATVVNATDERIADATPLQTVITEAVRNNSTIYERVTGEQFKTVNETLHRLEPYADTDPSVEDGYYIRKNETVVVVTLRVEQ